MSNIIKFPTTIQHRGQRRAVAFYYSPKKLTDEHQRIETPAGPAYIRVQVTPAQDLVEVFDHMKEISDDECFMNGHWVYEEGQAAE
jgi:CRISPR/Cas system CMR-associated protein Cmr5 small subunit